MAPLHTAVEQPLGLRARAVVSCDGVPLIEQPRDHVAAHHSESHKTKIRHSLKSPDSSSPLGACRFITRIAARILAHLRKMGLHGGARTLRITALDCIENVSVVALPALRAAANVENPQALFAQQSHD